MIEYCAIWCRVSTEKQAKEGLSLDAQEDYLRDYADRNELIPLKVFRVDESGYKEVRKEFDGMLGWMRANEVKVLLVEKQDRYSRQSREDFISSLKRVCDEYEIAQIHFPKDGKLWDRRRGWTAGEKFQARVMSAVATYKSDIISDEVKKAFKEKCERGEYPGRCPVGYFHKIKRISEERIEREIVLDPEREPLVREAFELYATNNYSIAELTKMMKDKGLTSKPQKGKKPHALTKSGILGMLRTKLYSGFFDWGGKEYKGTNYKAIITRKLWDKVQKILSDRAIKYTSKHVSSAKFFRYRGLLTCGYCGCGMTPMDMSTNYKNLKPGEERYYYRCTYQKKATDIDWYRREFGLNHSGVSKRRMKVGRGRYNAKKAQIINCPQLYWKESEIDQKLKLHFEMLALDKELLQDIKKQLGVTIEEQMTAMALQRTGLETQLTNAMKVKKGLVRKLALEEHSDVALDLQEELVEVKSEIETLQGQVAQFDEEIKQSDVDELVEVLTICSDLHKQYDKLKPMDKRRLVMTAFSKIEVQKGWIDDPESDNYNVTVEWAEPFNLMYEKWMKEKGWNPPSDEMKKRVKNEIKKRVEGNPSGVEVNNQGFTHPEESGHQSGSICGIRRTRGSVNTSDSSMLADENSETTHPSSPA